jgi:uncharacterized protein with PIN domain
MQITMRCFSCHTPFHVKDEEIIAALDHITEEGHKHYNALCPRCGKANKLSKAQLKRSAPNWEPKKK